MPLDPVPSVLLAVISAVLLLIGCMFLDRRLSGPREPCAAGCGRRHRPHSKAHCAA